MNAHLQGMRVWEAQKARSDRDEAAVREAARRLVEGEETIE
jgi:hypothetical protein